jgi:lipopolysaccharide/colanic/teichoic acid biosynthesis glycosyltransferase
VGLAPKARPAATTALWARGSVVRQVSSSASGDPHGFAIRRALDLLIAGGLLFVLSPLIFLIALAIKLESPGPIVYRSRRVGFQGREFGMLKFRKMIDGAAGPLLTKPNDERFTRLGRLLGRSKLDELPQLWNVLRGEMSLVGPRPEASEFVALYAEAYEPILQLRPGITGPSQLAFAKEALILDPNDRVGHYLRRILPQKLQIDLLYAAQSSTWVNLRILGWTALVLLFDVDVAVDRKTGRLGRRRRPSNVSASADQAGS